MSTETSEARKVQVAFDGDEQVQILRFGLRSGFSAVIEPMSAMRRIPAIYLATSTNRLAISSIFSRTGVDREAPSAANGFSIPTAPEHSETRRDAPPNFVQAPRIASTGGVTSVPRNGTVAHVKW